MYLYYLLLYLLSDYINYNTAIILGILFNIFKKPSKILFYLLTIECYIILFGWMQLLMNSCMLIILGIIFKWKYNEEMLNKFNFLIKYYNMIKNVCIKYYIFNTVDNYINNILYQGYLYIKSKLIKRDKDFDISNDFDAPNEIQKIMDELSSNDSKDIVEKLKDLETSFKSKNIEQKLDMIEKNINNFDMNSFENEMIKLLNQLKYE